MLVATLRTVELVIDFGDGVAKVIALEWRKGMTAEDALKRASEKPLHGILYRITPHALGALVTEIDGEANETDGPVRRSWMYSVNGEMAEVGCGQYELKPNDIVRGEYTVYEQSAT